MKTACIYHSIDLDGWMSAAIVKKWYMFGNNTTNGVENTDNIDFIGYNYGQPVPNLDLYDIVIMCDISFPVEEMIKLSNKLIWIDHHISAILNNPETTHLKYEGIRDTKFSACELTWKYFFPDNTLRI